MSLLSGRIILSQVQFDISPRYKKGDRVAWHTKGKKALRAVVIEVKGETGYRIRWTSHNTKWMVGREASIGRELDRITDTDTSPLLFNQVWYELNDT